MLRSSGSSTREVHDMPTIEVTICPLTDHDKQRLIGDLTELFVTPEVPAEWITIVFRHIEPGDFVRGGRLPLVEHRATFGTGPSNDAMVCGPGIVDITIGPLEEAEKRRVATGVSDALATIGVPDDLISIHFRHVTGRDVAGAGGMFPFRPSGSQW
jgi:phenylpyruvate tautomerase PptA (4-oxalocrotonate tautomerase family)